MVKHIILWKFNEMSEDELKKRIECVKENLEGLAGKIPGMIEIKVNIDNLATSNADAMLDSTFESAEALKGYSMNPEHIKVAETFIRPYISTRLCYDFEI